MDLSIYIFVKWAFSKRICLIRQGDNGYWIIYNQSHIICVLYELLFYKQFIFEKHNDKNKSNPIKQIQYRIRSDWDLTESTMKGAPSSSNSRSRFVSPCKAANLVGPSFETKSLFNDILAHFTWFLGKYYPLSDLCGQN